MHLVTLWQAFRTGVHHELGMSMFLQVFYKFLKPCNTVWKGQFPLHCAPCGCTLQPRLLWSIWSHQPLILTDHHWGCSTGGCDVCVCGGSQSQWELLGRKHYMTSVCVYRSQTKGRRATSCHFGISEFLWIEGLLAAVQNEWRLKD